MHAFVQSTALGFFKIRIGDIGKKVCCVCVCVCVCACACVCFRFKMYVYSVVTVMT